MSTTTVHHGVRRRTFAWLAIAALLAASFVAATTSAAHADEHWDIGAVELTPTGNDEVPEYDYSFDVEDDQECEVEVVVYPYPVDELDDPAPIDTTIEVTEDTETSGTVRFPDLDPGFYDLQVATCAVFDDEVQVDEVALFSWGFGFASLQIDKNVEGDAPDDATFVIEVVCEYLDYDDGDVVDELTHEREFAAGGGTSSVVMYPVTDDFAADISCAVAETEDGGADEVDIQDGDASFELDELFAEEDDTVIMDPDAWTHTTTVTNTFPEADEDDDEDDEDDDEDDEDEPEAEPAEAVVAQPDYTG